MKKRTHLQKISLVIGICLLVIDVGSLLLLLSSHMLIASVINTVLSAAAGIFFTLFFTEQINGFIEKFYNRVADRIIKQVSKKNANFLDADFNDNYYEQVTKKILAKITQLNSELLDWFKAVSPTREKMKFDNGIHTFLSLPCEKITLLGLAVDQLFPSENIIKETLNEKNIEIFILDPDCPLAKYKDKELENELGKHGFIKKLKFKINSFEKFVASTDVQKIKNHSIKVYKYNTPAYFSAIILEMQNQEKAYYISPHVYSKEPKNCPCFHIVTGNKLYEIYHDAIEKFFTMYRNDQNLFIANNSLK